MKAKELADLLNGREYRDEITKEEAQQAKENGLVVVFGASDDLIEFEGAISEEFGAYDGTTIKIGKTSKGIKFYDEDNEHEIEEYNVPITTIEQVWCPRENGEIIAPWLVKADIPHEQFKIYEDGELYCIGIVFHIDDLAL